MSTKYVCDVCGKEMEQEAHGDPASGQNFSRAFMSPYFDMGFYEDKDGECIEKTTKCFSVHKHLCSQCFMKYDAIFRKACEEAKGLGEQE